MTDRYTITPIRNKYLVERWISGEYQEEIGTYDSLKEAEEAVK